MAIIGLICATTHIHAQTQVKPGFAVTAGLKTIQMKDVSFNHSTHPNDPFLPRSGIKGSAGETSLEGTSVFGAFGIRYEHPISKSLSWRFEFGGLAGGQEDRQKNANDPRPDANAAFVYSKAHWGFYESGGLIYYMGKFYFGGDAEYNHIFVEHGWDRFSKQESESSSLVSMFGAGPTIGYNFNENLGLEASAMFGKSQIYECKVIWKF